MAASSRRWATRADVVRDVRKRWDSGEFLTRFASGQAWEPLGLPLRTPTSAELATDFGAVQDWARGWERSGPLRLEHVSVGGRLVGVNRLPRRAWIDSYQALWRVLDVQRDVARFTDLVASTRAECPGVVGWMVAHPIQVLARADIWPELVGVTRWIESCGGPRVHLRQIDVDGVDTKFVETHRLTLGALLDAVLPAERIDQTHPRHRFAARYRMATKPSYVRLRRLDEGALLDPAGAGTGPAELTVRVEDLARWAPSGQRALVVENEISYLALPPVPGAVAILGAGYGLSRLAPLTWLHDRDVVYWGDIDTHGFAILDQLRRSFPHARAVLMDRDTLLAHERHWGVEDKPVNAPLDHLGDAERALYEALVEGTYGPKLRLEQERLRFARVQAALARVWPGAC